MLRKICCLDTDLCKCSCLGLTRNKNVKLGYIFLLLLAFAILLFINSLMHPQSESIIERYGCIGNSSLEAQSQCVQDKNSQIVLTAVAVMHLVLLCCMFLRSQKGMWLIKIIVIGIVALILRLLVATAFFEYLQYFSIWAANILYLFQAMVFIDLVYALDNAIDQCAKENHKLYILKAIISITILIGASFLCFLSFQTNPLWVCVVNAVSLVLFLLLALLRIFPENSIMVAGSVSLCLNILGFYIHQPDQQTQESIFLTIFKWLFLLFLLLGMLCQGSNVLRTRKSTLNELLALNTNPSEEDNRYVSSNKWTVYHYVMMMIGITVPALFCWTAETQHSEVPNWLWINKVVWWGSVLGLYLWSLLVMKLFPEQDFSDLENYFRQYQLK